jgi:hypothetical protein
MRPIRKFQPPPPVTLEDRVVLSLVSYSSHKKPAAVVRPANSEPGFPQNIADTLAAGNPVYEKVTIHNSDGSTQTETRLIRPDLSNATVLTTETIQLANNGGTEQYTDFAYTVGSTTTHDISITLPDGSLENKTITDQVNGNTANIHGTVALPAGDVQTISGTKVTRGPQTITNKTITNPDGSMEQERVVVVHHGELNSTTTTTTTQPGSPPKVTRSTTTIQRLQVSTS